MKNLLLAIILLPNAVSKGENSTIGSSINDVDVVTLTTYTPTKRETDSSPNITASGYKIDTSNPSKHRIIAVSRDLKKKWKFNQKVRIRKAGKYNGVYTVKDVMNKRYKKRVDILIGKRDKQIKLENVQIIAIK
jgi:3D (Asp-Asp-Asp) domain-containing protein